MSTNLTSDEADAIACTVETAPDRRDTDAVAAQSNHSISSALPRTPLEKLIRLLTDMHGERADDSVYLLRNLRRDDRNALLLTSRSIYHAVRSRASSWRHETLTIRPPALFDTKMSVLNGRSPGSIDRVIIDRSANDRTCEWKLSGLLREAVRRDLFHLNLDIHAHASEFPLSPMIRQLTSAGLSPACVTWNVKHEAAQTIEDQFGPTQVPRQSDSKPPYWQPKWWVMHENHLEKITYTPSARRRGFYQEDGPELSNQLATQACPALVFIADLSKVNPDDRLADEWPFWFTPSREADTAESACASRAKQIAEISQKAYGRPLFVTVPPGLGEAAFTSSDMMHLEQSVGLTNSRCSSSEWSGHSRPLCTFVQPRHADKFMRYVRAGRPPTEAHETLTTWSETSSVQGSIEASEMEI